MTTTTGRESFKSLTAYRAGIVDAMEDAHWHVYESTADDSASLRHYLDVMHEEYRCQAIAANGDYVRHELTGAAVLAADDLRRHNVAAAKRDAYADSLRVLDIAIDGWARGTRRRLRDLPPVVLAPRSSWALNAPLPD